MRDAVLIVVGAVAGGVLAFIGMYLYTAKTWPRF